MGFIPNKQIESILQRFKTDLDTDYSVYKNHVYRIFNYCITFDTLKENHDKYAIASAFHDLGIWTHSFDYLEPSKKLATNYLKSISKQEWIKEIKLIIDNHHKITPYKADFNNTVEVFRKADWIDVVNGLKLFKLDKKTFKKAQKTYPNKGFHKFLIKQSVAYCIKHPLNPLPMFKR